MKKIVRYFIPLLILTIFISSCDKKEDNPQDPNNPNNPNPNPNPDPDPQTEGCFDFYEFPDYVSSRVEFLDDNNGWFLLEGLPDDRLFWTADGGETWDEVAMPAEADFTVSKSSLKFINTNEGYLINQFNLAGDRLSYTTDRGATWTSVYDFSESMVTEPWDALAVNSQYAVFMRGIYWVMVVDNNTKEATMVEMPDEPFTAWYQLRGGEFHLSEDNVMTCAFFYDDIIHMAQSSDFGASWSFVQDLAISNVGSMAWPSDQVGYIEGSTSDYNNYYIYKTTDGGSSWTQLSGMEWINDIEFADENNGLATGLNLGLFTTEDGGASWSEVECTDEAFHPGLRVAYPSVNHGWVTGVYGSKFGVYHYEGE